MLKLREVAERLACSLANVYALVEKGKLTVVPTGANGKGYRVTEEELARFVEEGRHGRRPQEWPKSKPSMPKLKHITLS